MIIRGIEIKLWVCEPTRCLVVDPDGTGIWAKSREQAEDIKRSIFNDRGVFADIVNVSYT